MPIKPIVTDDGSVTLFVEDQNETYHSRHGAITESKHVFIAAGLREAVRIFGPELNVLEVGFGTGLNALLTLQECRANDWHVHYTTLETNPLTQNEISVLNYGDATGFSNDVQLLQRMHAVPMDEPTCITPFFALDKRQQDVRLFSDTQHRYHVIFFDAFGPRVQPELWTVDVFKTLIAAMHPRGILVTYCAKGEVRRAMEAAGFTVEKLKGPPGKKHMLRAISQTCPAELRDS